MFDTLFSKSWLAAPLVCNLLLALPALCSAQADFHGAPIHYDSAPLNDPVTRLAAALEDGTAELAWDEQHGWLPALLESLQIDPQSQTLVFSKTSRQAPRIAPHRPRALYFNDDTYIGAVQGGEFLELAAVDARQGAIFFALDQDPSRSPRIVRKQDECLTCHATHHTQDVPGFLIRSVIPNPSGHPEYRLGTIRTDHSTPFTDRFGGWYVTGQHGAMRHRGNVTLANRMENEIDREAGANLPSLPPQINRDRYLADGSDIVALMLLEHQSQMHNWITRASYACREALHYEQTMNRLLERPAGTPNESSRRRIERAASDLVRYLLFCDEYRLESPVRGAPDFQKTFESRGPRDSAGRSLRDLDLQTRLLKYPCSYLIYSESFLALPPEILTEVKGQMEEILEDESDSGDFSHLTPVDRKNLREILKETHPLFQ